MLRVSKGRTLTVSRPGRQRFREIHRAGVRRGRARGRLWSEKPCCDPGRDVPGGSGSASIEAHVQETSRMLSAANSSRKGIIGELPQAVGKLWLSSDLGNSRERTYPLKQYGKNFRSAA